MFTKIIILIQPDPAQLARERDAQRRRLLRVKRSATSDARPGTPEAIPGRRHADIQTDAYLEELTDRFIEFEAETQTDFLIDRPASPMFMPAKIGVDAKTQIYDGDLFDFDREVEPILEVLVGKTLEQSMMEVLEEEELMEIRHHQEMFERQRLQELLEVQRMEAAEQRRAEERSRRRSEAEARAEQKRLVYRKLLARNLARETLLPLRDRCLNTLRERGAFTDDALYDIETQFMPDILSRVVNRVNSLRSVHAQLLETLLEGALHHVRQNSNANIKKRLDDEEARVESLREKERQRLRRLAEEEERLRKEEEDRIRAEEEAAEQERLRIEHEAAEAEAAAAAALRAEQNPEGEENEDFTEE